MMQGSPFQNPSRDRQFVRDVGPDNQRVGDRLRRLESMRASEMPIDTIAGIEATDVQGALEEIMSSSVIAQAERVILSTYGDTVSVLAKQKNLAKFGRNNVVGTSWETVAEFQGTTANETYLTTNAIDSIVSDNTGDTTQTIVIEGHTVDGSGNLTFVVQEKLLTGQTEATLTTPLARATRAYVKPSGTFGTDPAALAGNVYIYDNTDGIASGVPNTAAATKLMILAGETQSEKAATSISQSDYWLILSLSLAIGDTAGAAAFVTVRMETRDVKNGGAWRPLGHDYTLWAGAAGIQQDFDPAEIVPKNHDWRIRAKADANTAEVYGEARGVLAAVQ